MWLVREASCLKLALDDLGKKSSSRCLMTTPSAIDNVKSNGLRPVA